MNDEIDHVKACAEADSEPLLKRLDLLDASLLAFAEYNKAELFEKKRSVELMYGLLGFRRSSEIKPKPKTTWAMVCEALKSLGFDDAVRVREDANKEVLREWPEERLDLVGARRVEKDTFWYEVKEEAVDHAREAV